MISLDYILEGMCVWFGQNNTSTPSVEDHSSVYADFPLGGKRKLTAGSLSECFRSLFPGYDIEIPPDEVFREQAEQATAEGHRFMWLRVTGFGIQIDATVLVAHGLANITLAQWDSTPPGYAPNPKAA